MKKILFVANVYSHLYTFHRPYIQMLKDNGCQVDVIATRDDRAVENADNCYYWNLTRSPFSFRNISAYYQLKKLVRKERYDLVHCHTATAAAVVRLVIRALRKKLETKILYTAHGFHFYEGSPRIFWLLYYPVEKFLSRYTDGIVLINSEDYNLTIQNGFKNKKTYYINGIGIQSKRFENADIKNRKKLRREEGYIENQFLMIYVAEFIYRKNHKFLVDASLELAKQIDNFKILFVGRGAVKQAIQEYAISVGADKYIDFLGVRWDLDRLFPMCDIGVSSSRQEGLGLAIAEEMLCGLPVLVSRIRGMSDLVINGETGFLYKQESISDFVKHAMDFFESPQKRIEMGKAAYNYVQKFKIEQILKSMAKIYSELLCVEIDCNNSTLKYVQ